MSTAKGHQQRNNYERLDIYNNERFKKFRRALARQADGVFPLCSRCCGLMGF